MISGMTLGYHGGRCCGIKTIYGMTYSPLGEEEELTEHSKTSYDLSTSMDIPSDFNIYPYNAPAETGVARLDRYLEYLKTWRPKGLVEINLNGSQAVWEKYLLDRGFKAVTTFINSNTFNTVTVYHLVMDDKVVDNDDDEDEGYDCDCPECRPDLY